MKCPYCQKPAKKVTGREIYPRRNDLSHLQFFQCQPCDAYVGCHKNSDYKPLGRLANKELRQWKIKAHAAFDPLWKSGEMSRHDAYAWLADRLRIDKRNCHIGYFDVQMCQKVVEFCGGVR